MTIVRIFHAIILIVASTLAYSQIFAQDNSLPTLQIGASEDIGIEDAVALYTYDALQDKGYQIEVTRFAESSFSIDALSNNVTNIATHSSRTVWSAIANNANIITVAEYTGMDFVMVGQRDIEGCDDWDNTTVAYNSATSMTAAIGNYYFETVCTDFTPDVVFISGSSNRVAGMMAGALDATVVHLDAALTIIEDSPDEFYMVADLPKDFPWIIGAGVHVSTEFTEEYPEIVQDLVITFLQVLREVNDDPTDLIAFTSELMEEDPEDVTEIINVYIEANMFSEIGGLTEARINQTLDFFVGTGDLPADLTMEDVVDLTFIEHALEEVDSE
jgi:ABC-type nitrate/sulfonate/bicarbonate transport system substrate-binding protein